MLKQGLILQTMNLNRPLPKAEKQSNGINER